MISIRLALILAFLVVIAAVPAAFASHREAQPAPDFALPTTNGTVSLQQLQGKVVYVDFWASWCIPCRQSFPWMATMSDKYGAQGLQVVAINLDKSRDLADAFLDKYPASFTVAFDPYGKTAERFHVQAMPSSFLIDRTGKIVLVHEGFDARNADTVESKIKEALAR